jgi:hypothetical protein
MYSLERVFEQRGAEWGRAVRSAGPRPGRSPRSRACSRCRCAPAARPPRREAPAELLAHHDPGEPWLKWACPIKGCGHRVIIPHELERLAAAEHPSWTATYELLRPYPNQLQRVVYRQVEIHR